MREHLAVFRLPPEREIDIVEELALHFEAVYEDALAAGGCRWRGAAVLDRISVGLKN